MKRVGVMIAGVAVLLVASFYISARLLDPPSVMADVAKPKQSKLDTSTLSFRPLNRAAEDVTAMQEEFNSASCSARLGSPTRCTKSPS
jgi:hypothetical protein